MTRIAFVSGGTAGHINPALAIAEILERQDPSVSILFLGRANSMEERLLERTHYPFKSIPASPLYFRPKALFRLFRDLIKGKREATKILQEFDADVVFATGGFVSAPVLAAANKLGIPVVIHEANAFAGRVNRYLGARASTVCISYEETRDAFAKADRIVLTGNPVRTDFIEVDIESAKQELHATDPRQIVLISGGSQGAQSICEASIDMARLINEKPEAKDVRFVLSTGRGQYETYLAKAQGLDHVLEIKDFIYDMHKWMAGSDLLVSRAGAISSSETAMLGRPSIMVPYPFAAEDHQTMNAQAFVNVGAAVLISDDELTGERLYKEVSKLLRDPVKLDAMGRAAKVLAREDAADLIAEEVWRLARNPHE